MDVADLDRQLRRERLVGREDEGRLLHRLDELGDRERLARAGHAEERLVAHARADAVGQQLDRLRLIACRFVLRDDSETTHGASFSYLLPNASG